ncbi:nucleoside triphosphate pyrophosphohydrolase family protein [Candidatus Uhrbacteria bacterium]|nr:nucleoside triphosphate pyrophosphohydrolase family protein [Candidatus Uhrbacteria bacterium]
MTPQEYIANAMRTDKSDYGYGPTGGVTPRIEHAVMGTVTEAGELLDAVKKAKIYGKPLDRVNLVEEAGDCMWYLALLCTELGVSFEQVWEKNIAKLRARYPEKFTQEHALARDLETERKILET